MVSRTASKTSFNEGPHFEISPHFVSSPVHGSALLQLCSSYPMYLFFSIDKSFHFCVQHCPQNGTVLGILCRAVCARHCRYHSPTAAAHGALHNAPHRSAHSGAVSHSRALPGGSAMSGMSQPAQTPVAGSATPLAGPAQRARPEQERPAVPTALSVSLPA